MDGGVVKVDYEALKEEGVRICLSLRPWAQHMTRSPDRADDLIQETALRVVKYIRQFQPGTNLSAWIKRIMHNCEMDRRRQRKRDDRHFDGGLLSFDAEMTDDDQTFEHFLSNDDHLVTEEQVYAGEIEVLLRQVLNKDQYELLAWFRREQSVDGSSCDLYRESARYFGVSEGTIKSRLWRARILARQVVEASRAV